MWGVFMLYLSSVNESDKMVIMDTDNKDYIETIPTTDRSRVILGVGDKKVVDAITSFDLKVMKYVDTKPTDVFLDEHMANRLHPYKMINALNYERDSEVFPICVLAIRAIEHPDSYVYLDDDYLYIFIDSNLEYGIFAKYKISDVNKLKVLYTKGRILG
jgi:hypothetical protein